MKYSLFAILSLLTINGFSQEPDFATAGEQENYWAKMVFEKEYSRHEFSLFKGKITEVGNTFYFDLQALTIFNSPTDLRLIFSKGLLYPEQIIGICPDSLINSKPTTLLLRCDSARISNIEELYFLNHSFKEKRFRFLLWRLGLANPQVCYFELTNENATKGMSLREFISGAKLTFYKARHIQI